MHSIDVNFFFNDTATTEIYTNLNTLSLHDALPISVRTVPTAILSRQVAGTRGNCLIINLPGKPAAIEECLGAVWAAVPYCMDLIGGPRLLFSAEAPAPFRPTSA